MKKHPFQEWHDKTPIGGGSTGELVRHEREKAWNAAMDYIAGVLDKDLEKAINNCMAKSAKCAKW